MISRCEIVDNDDDVRDDRTDDAGNAAVSATQTRTLITFERDRCQRATKQTRRQTLPPLSTRAAAA